MSDDAMFNNTMLINMIIGSAIGTAFFVFVVEKDLRYLPSVGSGTLFGSIAAIGYTLYQSIS